MPGQIVRGAAAITEAAESRRGDGNFRPFIPAIYWKEDREERYILFLNDIDSIPTLEMIGFIPTEGGFFQETVAKTDPFFGQKKDEFVTKWDAPVRKTNIAVAVELEPMIEVVDGRKKPRGFEVKTVEYDRRIPNEDGELTDETEEVVAPAIGIVAQSPFNFFNVVAAYDATEAPIHKTPLKIKRVGKDSNTTYTVVGYDDQEIDLSNLLDYVDGISYLNDDLDEVIEALGSFDDEEAAAHLGEIILEKRIEELLDGDRYDELLEGVTESMDIYGNKKKKKGKGKERKEKVERKTRQSQRRSAAKDEVEDTSGQDDPETEPEAEPEVEEKPKTRRTSKAKASSEKISPQERMKELKARAEARKAA